MENKVIEGEVMLRQRRPHGKGGGGEEEEIKVTRGRKEHLTGVKWGEKRGGDGNKRREEKTKEKNKCRME